MSEHNLLAKLAAAVPEEIQAQLFALAEEQGAAGQENLEQVLHTPALLESAIEALAKTPSQDSWDLLEWIAGESTDRKLRKAARRAQHRLRSKGFQPSPTPPSRPSTQPATRAWASIFDFSGDQLLRVVQQAPLGMMCYARFVVSPEGLQDSFSRIDNQADVEAVIADEDKRIGDELIETTPAYAARRVQEAAALSRELGKPLPEYFLDDIHILQGAPEDPWPEELDGTDDAVPTPQEIQDLLEHPQMRHWLIPARQMAPYVEDWLKIQERLPAVAERGVPNLSLIQERGGLTARIIADTCAEETCQRLAGQLREQARLFLGGANQELAHTAVRCARALEKNRSSDSAFLRALVGRSMDFALNLAREQKVKQEEEANPWRRRGSQGGALWVPQPKVEKEEEEEPGSTLWLPGQR